MNHLFLEQLNLMGEFQPKEIPFLRSTSFEIWLFTKQVFFAFSVTQESMTKPNYFCLTFTAT
jgi:c-di-GMP-binding flagellar brake protein YcgR